MATYLELTELHDNADLLKRVCAGIAVAAEQIRTEDPATANHEVRLSWAKVALRNVDGMGRQMMWVLLAQNAAYTVPQIEGSSDAQILAAVFDAIDLF